MPSRQLPCRAVRATSDSKSDSKANAMDVAPEPSGRPRRTYQPTAAALSMFASGVNAFSAREQSRFCCDRKTGSMLPCSGKNCPNGGKIHPKCAGMKHEDVLFLTTGSKER